MGRWWGRIAPPPLYRVYRREKNILLSDFVWTQHKFTENLFKLRPKYNINGHYFGETFVLAITFYQCHILETIFFVELHFCCILERHP